MKKRKLRDIEVSAIGYGCMGLSHGYGELPTKKEASRLNRKAFELGCSHFDTAESYGRGENEKLLGDALFDVRGEVTYATKLHLYSRENLKQQVEE